MGNLPYADIIILALIAGFILLRLRSVLGQKTGNDNPQFFNRERSEKDDPREPVVQVTGKALKQKPADEADIYLNALDNPALSVTLNEIKKIDPQFSATAFLQGAKIAYEMVFDAFAKGDKKTLEMLLDKHLYDTFSKEIDDQAKQPHKTEITLVSIKAKDISQASLIGSRAQLTVKFDGEQVSLTKDADGKIIEGNASNVQTTHDDWVFERDVSSKNPSWKIIET